MRLVLHTPLCWFLAIGFAAGAPWAVAKDKHQSASILSFDDREAGSTHELVLTGYDRRHVFIFRVYEIAHYVDATHFSELTPPAVVEDGPAKAIAVTFARNLGVDLIRKEFEASIRRNAEEGWLEAAAPTLTAFMAAIDRDARKGDRLIFYWLDGGRVFVEFNGVREFEAKDPVFAKLIWSIWFGENPVCDREELLARLDPETLP